MKYLSEYMEEAQSAAFKEADAFFAFSNEQFNEQKKPGIKYTNMGMGLLANRDKANWLHDELHRIYKESILQDIHENGLNAIIRRELNNHEAYYTGYIDDTWEALKDYPGITEDCVLKTLKNKNYICPNSTTHSSPEISPIQLNNSGN